MHLQQSPVKKLPDRMLIEMVYACNFWLNCFLADNGISATLSLQTIIAGLDIISSKYCCLEFDSYVQTHEEFHNSMSSQTTRAIANRQTGNSQDWQLFY
jgi:hypothetical protein